MRAELTQLLALLAAAPGKELFQGLTISATGRCQALYRWGALNFENLAELEAYYEQHKGKPETTVVSAIDPS